MAMKLRKMRGAPLSTFFAVASLVALMTVAEPASAGDAFKGRDIYNQQCAICHGASGKSETFDFPDFTRYDGMMQPDANLLESIKTGANDMPGYLGILNDTEILDVIAYMRTLMR